MLISLIALALFSFLTFTHSIGVYWLIIAERKRIDALIKQEEDAPTVRISETELRAIVRVIAKDETASIEGAKIN